MKSTFRVLFFLKRDKVKKNGNMGSIRNYGAYVKMHRGEC